MSSTPGTDFPLIGMAAVAAVAFFVGGLFKDPAKAPIKARASVQLTKGKYTCTKDQLVNLEKEFDLCIRTNIPSEQCFYSAKSTQCEEL